MLIECLIKRDGPTRIGLNGFNYEFKMNGRGHYVALVNSREHRNYLLSLPDFRIYESPIDTCPAVGLKTEDAEPVEHPVKMQQGDSHGNRKLSYRRRKADHPG